MCGIAGFYQIIKQANPDRQTLERMIYPLQHRGPDDFGFYAGPRAGLAHARLSIIDLEGGWQPLANEDKTLWIAFNGEIFNYPELREEFLDRGHTFTTHSDTEVIIHLYEELGPACLDRLNGQFAIAIYDEEQQQALFLARDRLGIRPLFYTEHKGCLYFGSEMKSLFAADPELPRQINHAVLSEIFTFWSPAGAETIFTNVKQLLPGHYLQVDSNGIGHPRQYWPVPFAPDEIGSRSEQSYARDFHP